MVEYNSIFPAVESKREKMQFEDIYRVSLKKVSIKNFNSDLLITSIRTVLVSLYPVYLQVLFGLLFVIPWIIYEWMGNSTRHKVRNKALDDFDWLSQWLE